MTHYSLDTNVRNTIYFILAAISILTFVVLQQLKEFLSYDLVAPSAMVIFGTTVFLYDIFIWKTKPFQWITGIPDLNGKWEGEIISWVSLSAHEKLNVSATITQTFSRIQVAFETDSTESISGVSGLYVDNRSRRALKYSYNFRSKNGLEQEKTRGEGFNELIYSEAGNGIRLEGPYFGTNGRSGLVKLRKCN